MRHQFIAPERRDYNQWAANETLEDFALRFTARRARLTPSRVAHTAVGALAFLACEAIGGSLTLAHGTRDTLAAIGGLIVLALLIGWPITRNAARSGLDIDLLTRGAGFGYIGSTITSLVYASFTFVLFAIEASIMSVALNLALGVPLWLGHLVSALVVLPIAAFGIRRISKMQRLSQPVWLVFQIAPLLVLVMAGQGGTAPGAGAWLGFGGSASGFDLIQIGAGISLLLSLLPQIGEQVDYLRFLPERDGWRRRLALGLAGPGWVLIAGAKIALGSWLTVMAIRAGVPPDLAAQPAVAFDLAFRTVFGNPLIALVVMGVFVCVAQVKINVTNAYAGSIAWSNFFSRLTHNHPGRVVWLVFNTALALMLMELGVFGALESILDLYGILAVGWLGAVAGDLAIAKPLGLSPKLIEFKRAHLYDINPVGCGAMALSVLVSILCLTGLAGEMAQAFCVPVGLLVAFLAAPCLAYATGGRFYIARQSQTPADAEGLCQCGICANRFDPEDMAQCPAYGVPICSLCCSLEGRCRDLCKPDARLSQQIRTLSQRLLPARLSARRRARIGQVAGLGLVFILTMAGLLGAVRHQVTRDMEEIPAQAVGTAFWVIFVALAILSGLMAWFFVLAHENRRQVEDEFERQAEDLRREVSAREEAEAEARKAREVAEAANFAKSRFLTGLSHEIRSPLNAIYGYAQLMERDISAAPSAVGVIRRSAEHLGDLVDGLQDISRVESGTLVLARDRVALPELLDQLAEIFRFQAEAKGLEFVYDRQGWLPRQVLVDRKRLRQVLINLLSNAVKFTEAGQVGMRLRYRSHILEVEVFDTGMGIAPEDLGRIFDPFDRGTRADLVPGTGLGLTITKLLVEIMGGQLRVESAPAEGTRMFLQLLMFEASGGPQGQAQAIAGYEGPRKRLLLVDDDADHLALLRRILAPLGFQVVVAQNGAEALRLAPSLRPDLALLDITMPVMTGWELAGKLRALSSEMRIVMLSGNAHDSHAEGAGVHDAFLPKPVDLDAVVAEIGRLLDLRWREAQPARPPAAQVKIPREMLERLLAAAEIGHRRGVLDILEGRPAGSVAHWMQLAQGFELPRLAQELRALLEEIGDE
ncbi:ATP-binding protein (plasmid) [Thioclava sp. 'Guangxiensis']|uniref:hybrid sensor histidine kinase/response regulator n=1 Tax=Thioclava sp. 'Guangxiensis' TaxID=3149044 RepID=UPI0032C493E1